MSKPTITDQDMNKILNEHLGTKTMMPDDLDEFNDQHNVSFNSNQEPFIPNENDVKTNNNFYDTKSGLFGNHQFDRQPKIFIKNIYPVVDTMKMLSALSKDDAKWLVWDGVLNNDNFTYTYKNQSCAFIKAFGEKVYLNPEALKLNPALAPSLVEHPQYIFIANSQGTPDLVLLDTEE